MRVRIGVNVPNFGPGTDPEMLERWAQVVEGLGYDLLMLSDHVVVTPDVARVYPEPFFEPLTTLAYLAAVTSRVQIGTTILVMPYRHPLLTARMATNLDRLSGGRLVVGVGVGWARQEFEALGLPFERRGAMTDDYLAEFRAACPDPPLWIGGSSDAALRRAIRFDAAWHPLGFTMDWLRAALDRLDSMAQAAGRPMPSLAPRIELHLTESRVTTDQRKPGEGALSQVLADIDDLRALGAEAVVLDSYGGDPRETLRPHVAWQALATVADALAEQRVGPAHTPQPTERATA